ncbi:single-stranded DNA-binding protein [Demequina sp. SYSU T00039]|uniref:Single-stranded DNA-binding protein n=1 Tax=Demequina lignilytica TaxID=3051663 RepID=A0AAW7M7H3_9MICO|nr:MULTISPECIES: single-stranded DNA-binding protein [unclassified Demequina]MDN4479275.1 single-stranded DNA-binding protein [Demequina sp. SYSU T00039-1]MDN4487593.1 single-stranded DNA-binding protein [Demequina sp. SYSU T00039]
MNELQVTVVGWAATDVRLTVGKNGAAVASFRLASTPRYFDRARGEWVDGSTEWFTVRAFRGSAILIKQSVEKGQPVLVTGRMRTNLWESEKGPRTDLVIDATAVGHDLTRGFATFTRAVGDESMGEGDGTAAGEAIEAARGEAEEHGPGGEELDEPEDAEVEEPTLVR